jgi:dGTPase
LKKYTRIDTGMEYKMKLSSYACDPEKSAGRLHKEKFESIRLPYFKDRDRVIHSSAFRRLEYKTQVFVNHAGDHYRTRLTHSLEVAQISKLISAELGLNQELSETVALCHDIGHPPFGHAGEDGLNEAAQEFGGFDHNVQTMRVITYLEQKYPEFDGLNLTWETLEGVAKHNGPFEGKENKNRKTPKILTEISNKFNLRLDTFPSLEAQVAGYSDDIAYSNHDIDDGIRAGLIKIEDLRGIHPIGSIHDSVLSAYPNTTLPKIISETIRRIVKHMINDLIHETQRNIDFHKIKSPQDARDADREIVCFSEETLLMKNKLRSFLMDNVYRNYRVNRMTFKAKQIVTDLFNRLMEQPDCLPTEWYDKIVGKSTIDKANIIIDYIAGMTDRYAIEEHRKLFNPIYF